MTGCADPVARLRSVTHRYNNEVAALNDITLDIPKGMLVGLIGPDGVGKSTLQGLVAGVREIQGGKGGLHGKVTVLGGDMADWGHRHEALNHIAYMPQGLGRNLYPTLSVFENIDFFGQLFGQSKNERAWRIEDLLRSTGLAPFWNRPAGKLSGGMKQKLALCCALIHDPDLLILDEPTTGVDPLSRQLFWELIERVRERRSGMSVLAATAYMEEAEAFDHLIAMNDGRVLAEGCPRDLKNLTSQERLEDAFIALLPHEMRKDHKRVILPPRVRHDGAPAIEAVGLTMRFGDFTAVDNVTLNIERGEIFGFLGSNGCGKTTTMKMLTGLLLPSEGSARLFGHPVTSANLEIRKRVGYMSQSFSLYRELSVRQNLVLHARLFHLPSEHITTRVEEMLARFHLEGVADRLPEALPLGQRQRLQLAVAVIHGPEILILDEPTSGVDPVARDEFWEMLIGLSRDDNVTIFISTHFVNEAERCDRVSLMHAGRILAKDTPEKLRESREAATLSEAFIDYLKDASRDVSSTGENTEFPGRVTSHSPQESISKQRRFDPTRLWAFAQREATELSRDPIRIAFALIGPLVLMLTMGYGISFDIKNLPYAAFDQDQSRESRMFLEHFDASRYFEHRTPIHTSTELDRRLDNGELRIAIVIPPGYGRDLLAGRKAEIGVWVDGANSFRGETARSYVQGVIQHYLADQSVREAGAMLSLFPANIETRFRYNQAFKSVYAIAPGVLMMALILIPAMLTALGVVREKEMGSINNLYAAPVSKLEFLIGKQLPYIGVAMMSFVLLVILMVLFFGVPMRGNIIALAMGALVYTTAATGFGLVMSCLVSSQIAAVVGTAILAIIPTLNFSGMLYPVSTLNDGARIFGQFFPTLYFQKISSGVFNKGLGFAELYPYHLTLIVFSISFWLIAGTLLKKQAR